MDSAGEKRYNILCIGRYGCRVFRAAFRASGGDMFGYVTPLVDELKVKEHIFYKSVYCGLCRSMGKTVCPESTVTLSYDAVFLVLVRMALTGCAAEFGAGRCTASPLKKKPYLKSNAELEYCAAAGALLAYYSIEDNARDSRGFPELAARTALLFSRRMRKKAGLPELSEAISDRISELSEIEGAGEKDPDRAAEKSGEMTAEVFSHFLEGDAARIAREIGFHVGKWVYFADAADDYYRDLKRKAYNPLPGPDAESLRCAMNLELEGAAAAFELIGDADPGIKNIIGNILYLGMPARAEKILSALENGTPDPHKKGQSSDDRPL